MISPCAERNVLSCAWRAAGTSPATTRTISRDPGPETRITATPDGGLPLDSAKIVSGNCICAGLPIALTSGPITGWDPRVPLPQANLLSEETSPYLRQHKDNPVHWRPWSAATLTEARELDRPILLSVGYAACHWCHVMAHECFEDAEVAELMNRLYVNIKVDREERPDIDQIYMAALSATGEQGGWPLTMFLTPEAKPFWGGTYFPKQPRYGRPGFMQVLESIDRAWRDKRGELAASAETSENPCRINAVGTGAGRHRDCTRKLAGPRRRHSFHDRPIAWGATRRTQISQRTIHADALAELARNRRRSHRDAVLLSLRPMLNGGIYDHIGGGLCRYSTDADWLVPHFEKMLYDNAMLIRLANWAYAETGDQLFRERIETTIGWLVREMRIDGGGFAASLDADSDGEEGSFYTWEPAEVETALANDAPAFFSAYTLAAPHGWEGKPIVRRNASAPESCRDSAAAGQALRRREKRVRPGRDDKVLADWNGLAITAIAEASRHLGRSDWLDAARNAYRFVSESKSSDGRLPHSILGDRRLYPSDVVGLRSNG